MHAPSSSSSQPRPILKRQQTSPNYRDGRAIGSPERLHAVHFPPSPTLTRTYTAYPPSAYDRSPIEVAPNTCALPERGCPGRTYTLDGEPPVRSPPPSTRSQHGIHIHPRAVFYNRSPVSPSRPSGIDDGPQRASRRSSPVQPPLTPDLSSESDESDGFTSPPNSSNASLTPAPSISWPHALGDPSVYLMTPSYDHYDYPTNSPNVHSTLSYLPYSHSPDSTHKVRRRRQRDRSRERERERGSKYGAYAVDDEAHNNPSYKPSTPYGSFSTYALDGSEDSCLGGF